MSSVPETSDRKSERVLDEKVVDATFGLTVSKLRRYRLTGGGPIYLKIGGQIRYRPRDIEAFLESCKVGS